MLKLTPSQRSVLDEFFREKKPRLYLKEYTALRRTLVVIMWACQNDFHWEVVPAKLNPDYCRKMYEKWNKNGWWDKIVWILVIDMRRHSVVDLVRCFEDQKFVYNKTNVDLLRAYLLVCREAWIANVLELILCKVKPKAVRQRRVPYKF
jgi:hypothetical protein